MKKAGNFVCAALPSVSQHIDGVLKYDPGYLNNETINNFFQCEVNKFLSSVGVCLEKKQAPLSDKLFTRYSKVLNSFHDKKYLKNCEIILDSAGYQYQQGYIRKEDTKKFIDGYYNFLEEHKNLYSYAFTFDAAPGSQICVMDSFEEMDEFNRYSYRRANELSNEVKSKIIYIHHFRTPKINTMFKKLLEDGYADSFQNFSTGGLVSFGRGSFPVIMYIIPIMAIIKHAKSRNLKKFRFHVLGGSEWKDILAHKFFQYHIKNVHDIDIEITYDSSTIFKTLMMGRYVYVPNEEEKKIWKMSLRSELLEYKRSDIHQQGGKNSGTYIYELFNKMSDEYNFKCLNPTDNPIYINDDGSSAIDSNNGIKIQDVSSRISRLHYTYGMFMILQVFNSVDRWCDEYIKELYPLYLENKIDQFNNRLTDIMINFSDGKLSKITESRINAIRKSLDALTDLDLNYADQLVNINFSNDESPKLTGHEYSI